jgi:hypothetical protein
MKRLKDDGHSSKFAFSPGLQRMSREVTEDLNGRPAIPDLDSLLSPLGTILFSIQKVKQLPIIQNLLYFSHANPNGSFRRRMFLVH